MRVSFTGYNWLLSIIKRKLKILFISPFSYFIESFNVFLPPSISFLLISFYHLLKKQIFYIILVHFTPILLGKISIKWNCFWLVLWLYLPFLDVLRSVSGKETTKEGSSIKQISVPMRAQSKFLMKRNNLKYIYIFRVSKVWMCVKKSGITLLVNFG